MSFDKMKLAVLTITSIFFCASKCEKFNPNTFNYCTQLCYTQEHVACKCAILEPRELILNELNQFRYDILHVHNYWRNHVASGEAAKQSPDVPAAADMFIFNYDIELEYIAKCLASKFEGKALGCKTTHDGKTPGESFAGSANKMKESKLVKLWYDQIKSVENTTIDLCELETSKGVVKDFAQMVWSRTNLLGCSRVWNPKMYNSSWKYSLICTYGSTSATGVVTTGTSVYKKGEPCSDCPYGTKCETDEFKALCGKSLPIPSRTVILREWRLNAYVPVYVIAYFMSILVTS